MNLPTWLGAFDPPEGPSMSTAALRVKYVCVGTRGEVAAMATNMERMSEGEEGANWALEGGEQEQSKSVDA